MQYPFAIEAVAVPYKIAALTRDLSVEFSSRFIGSVNYSVPPRRNDFEGSYEWFKDVDDMTAARNLITSSSMKEVLEELGFCFYPHSNG
ncbi:MAG TPA: hypothetical protein VFI70_08600 [Nitrososphaeraceae archaeon]|nr:hypothetical protein [Nitrososphaeraceae archaeon]